MVVVARVKAVAKLVYVVSNDLSRSLSPRRQCSQGYKVFPEFPSSNYSSTGMAEIEVEGLLVRP